MTIRTAVPADVAGIATLVQHYWQFESIGGFERPRVEAQLHSFLTTPERGTCWVAESAGQIQGYLLAVLVYSLEYGGLTAEIDELFVTPAGRSVGVGSALLEAAERELTARGAIRVQLQLAVGNTGARAFYCKQGYGARSGYELLDKQLQGMP